MICLLTFSISSLFSLERLYLSKNLSFLLDCPFYLHIVVYSSLLWYLEFDTSVFLMKPALITLSWCEHKCKVREYKAGKVSPRHTEECTLIRLRNFFFFFFSFQFYCNIIDLEHWVSLRCTAQWFDLHTQWNDCHSKFREHPSSYIDIKEKKKNFPCFDAPYRMLGAGALGWPRGMVWGCKVGGGFRMGNTCTPVADSCQCMAKPIQYCKVKK